MSEIQEILKNFPIEEFLEDAGVSYRITHGSSGEQLNIKECPFCGGSSWKVYMNRETGLGNCFHGSCGQKFNGATFLFRAFGARSYLDLLVRMRGVARALGWRPERKAAVGPEEPREWRLPANEPLPLADGRMPIYLTNRGVTPEVAADFDLRWCARGFFDYTKDTGEEGHQPYICRIIIPVRDLNGEIVTFQGRDATGTADKKYLFPPGLPGSGKFLYNAHRAIGVERLVLVEGAFDVIGATRAIQTHGISNTVAVGSFGMHLSNSSDGQISRLISLKRQGLKEVTVMWDGESKAFDSAVRACVDINALGLRAKVATLPSSLDPGDSSTTQIALALSNAVEVNNLSAIGLRLRNPYS